MRLLLLTIFAMTQDIEKHHIVAWDWIWEELLSGKELKMGKI